MTNRDPASGAGGGGARAAVHIGEVRAGTLEHRRDGWVTFTPDPAYVALHPRPVLGQVFEDERERVLTSRTRVPPFFANLLPDPKGPLRRWFAGRLGVKPEREYFLLVALGGDLPGNVRVTGESVEAGFDASGNGGGHENGTAPDAPAEDDRALRFSLAGVQLKLSMVQQEGRGLTLPAAGQDGDWLVKLPFGNSPDVPLNEFLTMTWASRAGIDVPEFALDRTPDLGFEIPGAAAGESTVYRVRRFDRPRPGQRVHIEDLAQVLDVYEHGKYEETNYETVARILLRVAGRESFDEFLRRLVFVVASGNGDAHLKNWSLVYPDGIRARISPAYDLITTIHYIPEERLGLKLARNKRFDVVDEEAFRRLARKVGVDEAGVIARVRESVADIRAAWEVVRSETQFPDPWRVRLDRHLDSVPLLSGR